MTSMFEDCVAFNPSTFSNWDISKVQSLKHTFKNCPAFDSSVDGWDLSSVTSLEGAFNMDRDYTPVFNRDLSAWDTSSVHTLSRAFHATDAFEGLGIDSWDVSSVTDMYAAFIHTPVLGHGDLSGWDISQVTNFQYTFAYSTGSGLGTEGWDVSAGIIFANMFGGNREMDVDLNAWYVYVRQSVPILHSIYICINLVLCHFDVMYVRLHVLGMSRVELTLVLCFQTAAPLCCRLALGI